MVLPNDITMRTQEPKSSQAYIQSCQEHENKGMGRVEFKLNSQARKNHEVVGKLTGSGIILPGSNHG